MVELLHLIGKQLCKLSRLAALPRPPALQPSVIRSSPAEHEYCVLYPRMYGEIC